MKTRLGWVAAVALIASVLTGCGGGSAEDFCKTFEEFDSQDTSGLSTADSLDQFDELVDNAPDEIKDDVEVVNEEFQKIREAIEDTDVDLDAAAEDLSAEDQAALGEALQSADVDQEKISSATENIDTWAADNCEGATTE